LTFNKYGADETTPELTRQIRISNHQDKYPELAPMGGIRYSSDPSTENTFENAVNWLAKEGFPTKLSTRYKDIAELQPASNMSNLTNDGKLTKLQSSWRNLPKASRGDMPVIQDIENGMTYLDLIRR
jgi:hypothetical protein